MSIRDRIEGALIGSAMNDQREFALTGEPEHASGVWRLVPMVGICVMLMRGTCALALLLASMGAASAASGSNPLRHVSCVVVRFYVAKYTAPAAEAWARSHGATEAEIETARHCLNGVASAPIQPAAQVTVR